MIEGLKIRVPSSELKTHLLGRADHHVQRADVKEAELPALREAAAKMKSSTNPETLAMMSKSGHTNYHADLDDTVTDVETDIRNHRNKSLAFKFFAEHLFDEDYTLKEEDLIRLEILNRYS